MLTAWHEKKRLQLGLGLLFGICFGFLLQRGGATRYDVIIGQLLLTDFTVVKIMLTAVLVGMIGVHLLAAAGLARLQPKPGSIGMSVFGGLLFGVGFGILGYCPGTAVGAAGQGSLDALAGGIVGLLAGAWIFAVVYPRLQAGVLRRGEFGAKRLPELLHVNDWIVVVPVAVLIVALLVWLETAGL